MKPSDKLFTVIGAMIGSEKPLSGCSAGDRFMTSGEGREPLPRNINAAFLLSLAEGPQKAEARQYLDSSVFSSSWKDVLDFYRNGRDLIAAEVESLYAEDDAFRESLDALFLHITENVGTVSVSESVRNIRNFFFPEGNFNISDPTDEIMALRRKRKISIKSLNRQPLVDPAEELLLTSNVLLTLPPESLPAESLAVPESLKEPLRRAGEGKQRYWYDHPIQIGSDPCSNEVVYGLEKLDEALNFEKEKGLMARDARLVCVLSLSVTHEGLRAVSKEYIEDLLRSRCALKNLKIYVFTEEDCARLVKEVLVPAAEAAGISTDQDVLLEVLGVDGEYGRHYSFLKAVAAFWQVFVDGGVRASFKIDLDQVFPQQALLEQTGATAFGHFMSPLWGASGEDSRGDAVELGMLAGALVNERDAQRSLFVPDVAFPQEKRSGESLVFYSQLPQALSTEAEMMSGYSDGAEPDGITSCIQRIHVTGGTNGILIDCLRRYRPFTPSFIGRAEDQAYLLSVLFEKREAGYLRYAHRYGLVMRHDKEAFAGNAIEAARIGKMVGDYQRILLFSHYARRILPWPEEKIKEAVDPFTGCFVSRIPLTVVYLRFALKAMELSAADSADGDLFITSGAPRIWGVMKKIAGDKDFYGAVFRREKNGWDDFYDILDAAERFAGNGDVNMKKIISGARDIITGCEINLAPDS